MFIENRLCNPITHVKIVEIHMVKFNVSILNRLKMMGFFVNVRYIHKCNVILNETVTKRFTIFPYLNPTSYLKIVNKSKLQVMHLIILFGLSLAQLNFFMTFLYLN